MQLLSLAAVRQEAIFERDGKLCERGFPGNFCSIFISTRYAYCGTTVGYSVQTVNNSLVQGASERQNTTTGAWSDPPASHFRAPFTSVPTVVYFIAVVLSASRSPIMLDSPGGGHQQLTPHSPIPMDVRFRRLFAACMRSSAGGRAERA